MPNWAYTKDVLMTVEHDAENCTVCINRNKRKKKKRYCGNIFVESVLQGKTVGSKMFVRSALIRKNLVVDYLEKDVMQNHLWNVCVMFLVLLKNLRGRSTGVVHQTPRKVKCIGVKAFQDAQLELGDGYFESEK